MAEGRGISGTALPQKRPGRGPQKLMGKGWAESVCQSQAQLPHPHTGSLKGGTKTILLYSPSPPSWDPNCTIREGLGKQE